MPRPETIRAAPALPCMGNLALGALGALELADMEIVLAAGKPEPGRESASESLSEPLPKTSERAVSTRRKTAIARETLWRMR
jgi:hypothetical protein